jgi:cyclopropane fatty-acyl-phospholipid synthase-like methyltransferase
MEYFQIKDECRKGLLKYLEKAFSLIPEIDDPKILDIGCGTGVPTLWVAENYNGNIIAIDPDKDSIGWLKKKIIDKKLRERVIPLSISFSEFKSDPGYFDIIIAEGSLNVIGFERAFPKIIRMLGKNRYFIIHDEYMDHENKCDFIKKNNCRIIDKIFLDENVWWDDYYRMLETEIKAIDNDCYRSFFETDLTEIEHYKSDSSPFKSMYYVVMKL